VVYCFHQIYAKISNTWQSSKNNTLQQSCYLSTSTVHSRHINIAFRYFLSRLESIPPVFCKIVTKYLTDNHTLTDSFHTGTYCIPLQAMVHSMHTTTAITVSFLWPASFLYPLGSKGTETPPVLHTGCRSQHQTRRNDHSIKVRLHIKISLYTLPNQQRRRRQRSRGRGTYINVCSA